MLMFILLRGKTIFLCLIFLITMSAAAIFLCDRKAHNLRYSVEDTFLLKADTMTLNSENSNTIVVDAGHGA